MRLPSMRFTSLSPDLLLRRGWLPNQYLGHVRRPLTSTGKPSCDGSTAEFRIVDLITQHDVGADEKFSGSGHLGLWPASAVCQTLVETLQVLVFSNCHMGRFHHQVAQNARAGFTDPQKAFVLS